jgi:hypothetical protein
VQRRNFLKGLGLLSAAPVVPAIASTVGSNGFTNVNIRGKVSSSGKGLAKVAVSDGYHVVFTEKDGSYAFASHHNADHVFLSIPSGYEVPHEKGIARFYEKIDKNAQQQWIDFNLNALPQNDDRHAFIVWGDTQIQGKGEAKQLLTISSPDTKATIASLGNQPVMGIAVGDLVFDHFELFPDYKQAVEIAGVPFYQLIGNHDQDYTARTDDGSQATFKQNFGPTYYSFNRGKIHYIVLDNVFFIGLAHQYIGYLNEVQFSWLEKDLQNVPKGSTLVVCLHIPVYNKIADTITNPKEQSLGAMTSNREALFSMLKDYKVHFMTGHTHFNENWEKDNMMEHNHGTVCGAWWSGPICGDGTPSGYGVYQVNGNDISWYYKSTGFDKNHQLTIHAKGSISEKPTEVVANVWNWDPKWKVEWLEDGQPKGEMTQYVGLDPQAVELYQGAEIPKHHKWVEPVPTDHLFLATPSASAKEITVKATDRFGNVYKQSRKLA